ncbi:Condensin complex subunit 2 (Barren homolog) (Chromosome assembly protein xCAP-H) (Chromosome-associated protein H) (Non-SMC condensin I complex subunit H) [Durusdinium trenchii]|uniref:Condensin complex subunit 2 n=1 Tax=Durusdinium trenchii TaxID=1381693 RepID=A0ABP0QQ83_9DINO
MEWTLGCAEAFATCYDDSSEYMCPLALAGKMFRLAVEYPGYGLHQGTPNPESIEEMARSALDFILYHLQWPVDSVMVFGRSIGTGPAMAIAATPGLAGLILVSPFLSVQELIRDRIGGLAGFCEDFFVAKDAAPKVKCPTFILHGQADEVVSSNHSKTLFKMLVSRKLLVMPADMRHNSSLLSNLQHFVLPMFHFFSLPETCDRDLKVPCWSYHRRLAAQRALHPKAPRMLPENDSEPGDCGDAVELESLSSKTTSESCGRQLESFTPVASTLQTLQSWEAPHPDAQQPNKSIRVHFMRPRLADDEDCRVNENKISTKNAFELPLIEHMDDIVDSFMGGKKASCTIEASARIYACRVDCVHTDTYRVLGGLNSADIANEEEAQPGEDGKPVKKRRICGVNTLEKNEANLVQQSIEADEQSDPMFRRMAAAFDAGGAKGLLLSHLPLAEDMSLVFNGDVQLSKAQSGAEAIFKDTKSVSLHLLGLGDAAGATKKIEESRLCPELDSFRRQLWGASSFTMPQALEDLLGVAVSGPGNEALAVPQSQAPQSTAPDMLPDVPCALGPEGDDEMGAFGESDAPDAPSLASPPKTQKLVPLVDMSASQVLAAPASSKDDVVAFDELFEKFCGAGGSNQFAYFDECWSKLARDKNSKNSGALADAENALAEVKEPKERQSKKPLFDLTNLEKAAKPIETEAVGKHQMNEKASQWQLRKDVPPYMIDRITMPSWQTWSKVDFACLGLRPHLMLKLVRKPPPPTEGPHAFSDLFSTVVVENNEDLEELGEGEEDGGLPAHLEVLPGADEDLGGDMEDLANSFMANGLDFELAEKPTSAENVDIAYSRNSKFVDVKLVKKHLWGCLEKDFKKDSEKKRSFQEVVSRTVSAMPKGECENLSAAVCFICALHLCNEKNLELKTDPANPLGDFAIVAHE